MSSRISITVTNQVQTELSTTCQCTISPVFLRDCRPTFLPGCEHTPTQVAILSSSYSQIVTAVLQASYTQAAYKCPLHQHLLPPSRCVSERCMIGLAHATGCQRDVVLTRNSTRAPGYSQHRCSAATYEKAAKYKFHEIF